MTISKDLFLAILSMDAYNRDYGAGLSDGSGDDPDGLGDAIGTQLGNSEVSHRSSSDPNSDEVAAGFYAVAYTVGEGVQGLDAGTTVISYSWDKRKRPAQPLKHCAGRRKII